MRPTRSCVPNMPPALESGPDAEPDPETRRALLDLLQANDALRVARHGWMRAGSPRGGAAADELRRAESRVAEARRRVERMGRPQDKAWGGH